MDQRRCAATRDHLRDHAAGPGARRRRDLDRLRAQRIHGAGPSGRSGPRRRPGGRGADDQVAGGDRLPRRRLPCRGRLRRDGRGARPQRRAETAAGALAARFPTGRPRAVRRAARRAGGAALAAGRAGGRLRAQPGRVSATGSRSTARDWTGLPETFVERLKPGEQARDVSGQPGLPGGQPVPGTSAQSGPPRDHLPQELEQGGRREPAAAGRGAPGQAPDRRPAEAADLGPLRHGGQDGLQPGARARLLRPSWCRRWRTPRASEIAVLRQLHADCRRDRRHPALGLALLRHAPVDGAARRRPERGDRVPAAGPGARRDVRADRRGVRARLRAGADAQRLASIGPAVPRSATAPAARRSPTSTPTSSRARASSATPPPSRS